jgi:CBS domain-containing protein
VLVDESGRPVGIVTDRDLTVDVLADAADPETPAEECATTPVVTGDYDMELEEAAALMVQHRIRRLPILEDERLVGIVTIDDIAVRTGDLEVAQRMTQEVIEGALPEFFFHERG